MIGRIELGPAGRWAELWTEARPAGAGRVGGIVLGTVRAVGEGAARDRGLLLDILGRTIEIEARAGTRPGQTVAFRIARDGEAVVLEPVEAGGGDPIDGAIRGLGRLPGAQARAIVRALVAQGLPLSEEAFAALERAVAQVDAPPAPAARAGALLLSAGVAITPRALQAALLLLAPWPEALQRLRAAAAAIRSEAGRMGLEAPPLEELLAPRGILRPGGAAGPAGAVRGLVSAHPGEAPRDLVRVLEVSARGGALAGRVAAAARDWIAFLDARSILAAQGLLGRDAEWAGWALFALQTPRGPAPVRLRLALPRRRRRGRGPVRVVVDVTLPDLGRVWAEVVVDGRRASARLRAERARVRRALGRALPDLRERVAGHGIGLAGRVEDAPPPAQPFPELRPRVDPGPGLDVRA